MQFVIFISLLSYVVCRAFVLLPNRNTRGSLIFYILIIGCYIYSIRIFPQADMITYLQEMKTPIDQMITEIFFLREGVFWLLSSYISNLFGEVNAAFLFWDLIALLCVFSSLRIYHLPYWYSLVFFLSFPFLFGLENIYRQFLATCVLMLSISYVSIGKKWIGIVLTISSLGIHNSLALFLPIFILLFIKKEKVKRVFLFACIIMEFLVFPMIVSLKSSAETGANLSIAYLFMLLALGLPLEVFSLTVKENRYRVSFFLFLSIYVIAMLFLGGIVERIAHSTIILLLPSVFSRLESSKTTSTTLGYRMYTLFLCIAPSFLFSASLYFLENQNVFIPE